MSFLRILPLTCLLFCACDKPVEDNTPHIKVEYVRDPEPSEEEMAAMDAKIEELEREIESSEQIISDLEAAVHMERTKLEDDPNYDQSFLNEILDDQDREREDIKKAQEELDALQK